LGLAFEKMAKKAIGVSVRTKHSRWKRMIIVQKLNGLVLFSERKAAFSQFFQKP